MKWLNTVKSLAFKMTAQQHMDVPLFWQFHLSLIQFKGIIKRCNKMELFADNTSAQMVTCCHHGSNPAVCVCISICTIR